MYWYLYSLSHLLLEHKSSLQNKPDVSTCYIPPRRKSRKYVLAGEPINHNIIHNMQVTINIPLGEVFSRRQLSGSFREVKNSDDCAWRGQEKFYHSNHSKTRAITQKSTSWYQYQENKTNLPT